MSSISSSSAHSPQCTIASLSKRFTEYQLQAAEYSKIPELSLEPKDFKWVVDHLANTVYFQQLERNDKNLFDKTVIKYEIIDSLRQKLIRLREDALNLAEQTPPEDHETLETCLVLVQTIDTFAVLPFCGESSRRIDQIQTRLDDFILVDEFGDSDEESSGLQSTQLDPKPCIIS